MKHVRMMLSCQFPICGFDVFEGRAFFQSEDFQDILYECLVQNSLRKIMLFLMKVFIYQK